MFNYSRLPEHDQHGAKLWIENGVLPGGFLRAVISNDLKEAFARADSENLKHMQDVVSFWYNEAPEECWGSIEKVATWFGHSGLDGIRREPSTPDEVFLSERVLTLIQGGKKI